MEELEEPVGFGPLPHAGFFGGVVLGCDKCRAGDRQRTGQHLHHGAGRVHFRCEHLFFGAACWSHTSNPTSSFSVTTVQSVSVLFGVGPNASTGQFTLTVQGSSGTLSHSKSLTLSIQAAMLILQLSIPVLGAASVDLSADGSTRVSDGH